MELTLRVSSFTEGHREALRLIEEAYVISRYLAKATTPYLDIVPVTGIRAAIGNNVEPVFRSKVAGRVAVISQSRIKWYQVRPGLNSVLAPGFSDAYHLVFDTGYSKHVYRVEIPITTHLQVADAQARSLLRELSIR
jgi:hypothetical protein